MSQAVLDQVDLGPACMLFWQGGGCVPTLPLDGGAGVLPVVVAMLACAGALPVKHLTLLRSSRL